MEDWSGGEAGRPPLPSCGSFIELIRVKLSRKGNRLPGHLHLIPQKLGGNSPGWHASANSGPRLSSTVALCCPSTPRADIAPYSTCPPETKCSHPPHLCPYGPFYTMSFHLLPGELFHPSQVQTGLDITLVKLPCLCVAGICSELWAPTALCYGTEHTRLCFLNYELH